MTGDAAADSSALRAVESAEAVVRTALRDRLRTVAAADDAVADALREWLRRGHLGPDGDEGNSIDRAAARQANVLTNHVRYRVAVGRSPPEGLRSTPVAPLPRISFLRIWYSPDIAA